MSIRMKDAVDEILAIFKTAWDSTGHKAFYENTRDSREEDLSPWAEVVVRHAAAQQDTLGGSGNRSFVRLGALVVTINTPSSSGLSEGYNLANVVTDAYEGVSSPSGIWFRNVRVNELGREGTFFQLNVTVDFEYYELK